MFNMIHVSCMLYKLSRRMAGFRTILPISSKPGCNLYRNIVLVIFLACHPSSPGFEFGIAFSEARGSSNLRVCWRVMLKANEGMYFTRPGRPS